MVQATPSDSSTVSALSPRRAVFFAAAGYLLLTLLMFGDVLWTSKEIVLSNGGTDIFGQFLSWRKFGFDQLRQGNLPLWNPYVFSGAPYFGGFQSALLYPLNALYLFLPLTTAINYSIALHVFLAGLFVYLWTSYRKLHPLACFLAGVIWMFSGPFFLHIYAGHLSNLSTMIWAPLLFLAVDGTLTKPALGWSLLGMFALGMQILAGHPQYVFYTSFAVGLYVLLCLPQSTNKSLTLFFLGLIYVGGVGLTSIQLLTGIAATGETIRNTGVSPSFAASFSFPPENFLTLFAPEFFGDTKHVTYWGRGLFWEMCLFCGTTAFLLAAYGAVKGSDKQRNVLVLVLLLICLFALGSNTKLFYVMYYYLPGFNKFRSSSKFIFLAGLFISVLAAMGLDELIRRRKPIWPLVFGTASFVVLLIVAAFSIRQSASDLTGWWRSFTDSLAATQEPVLAIRFFKDPIFVKQFGFHAAHGLFVAAGVAAIVLAALILTHFSKRAVWLLAVISTVEMFIFAHGTRDTFDATESLSRAKAVLTMPSDEGRFNFVSSRNLPMYFGKPDIWGNDPGIPERYARLMAFTQSVQIDFVTEFDVVKIHPFFDALRCRFMVAEQNGELRRYELPNSLSHLQLVKNFRVIPERKALFSALMNKSFKPREEVIVESEPNPLPDPNGRLGEARIVNSSTDFLDIEADLPSAAILLITDSYTPSWRARSLRGSSQARYELLPADYCLRAVPLAAGHHKLRVEYTSKAFTIGKWISFFSLFGYLGVLGWWTRKNLHLRTAPAFS